MKIPHIIEANGKTSVIRVLDQFEMGNALKTKMQEEKSEFLEATSVEEQMSELADLVEVLYGILSNEGISLENLYRIYIWLLIRKKYRLQCR